MRWFLGVEVIQFPASHRANAQFVRGGDSSLIGDE